MLLRVLPIVLGVLLFIPPSALEADRLCPQCDHDDAALLSASRLVDLMVSTVLRQGVAVLIAGAILVVAFPWAVAGVALVAMELPRRVRPG